MRYCVLERLERLRDRRCRPRWTEGIFNDEIYICAEAIAYHGKERLAWARRCLQRQVGPVATFVTISTSDDIAGGIWAWKSRSSLVSGHGEQQSSASPLTAERYSISATSLAISRTHQLIPRGQKSLLHQPFWPQREFPFPNIDREGFLSPLRRSGVPTF